MAEVLITLGILGVVIAMTLPGVIEGYKEKELVTRFKRDYTILANAISDGAGGKRIASRMVC